MRKILLAGLTLALAACGNDITIDTPNPVPSNLAGSYSLQSVDGAGLPFPVLDVGAYHIQISSGNLALNANKTYVLKFGLRVDDSGNIRFDADSDAGTWTQSDNALSFTSTKGDIARTATVSGGTMTMQSSVRVFVLRK